MNTVLSHMRDRREQIPSPTGIATEGLLAELLILHEDMIEQLRMEDLGRHGSSAFLASQIGHHKQAIVALKAHAAQQVRI